MTLHWYHVIPAGHRSGTGEPRLRQDRKGGGFAQIDLGGHRGAVALPLLTGGHKPFSAVRKKKIPEPFRGPKNPEPPRAPCHLPLYDSQGLAESHLDVLEPRGGLKIGLARQ